MDDWTRYSPPSLDQHEDLLVGLKSNGVTHRNIQKELRRKHVHVSVSTIKRFFRSLPRERIEHKSSESRLVQDALERIKDRSEQTNDTKQAAYWIRHDLRLAVHDMAITVTAKSTPWEQLETTSSRCQCSIAGCRTASSAT